MHRKLINLSAAILILIAGALVATRLQTVHGQSQPGAGFAAVPGSKGGWDLTVPYDVVRDWPKPMSQLPDHENWSRGAIEGVFAESPNRVFIVQRGELPVVKRPPQMAIPQFGLSLSFPTARRRSATPRKALWQHFRAVADREVWQRMRRKTGKAEWASTRDGV